MCRARRRHRSVSARNCAGDAPRARSATAGGALPLALLLEDQQMIEPAQEEIALGRGAVEVGLLQRAVAAHDRDVVDRPEALLQQDVQLAAQRREGLALLEAVGDV